ncbi:hypothetical protein [Catenulispora subtropica]
MMDEATHDLFILAALDLPNDPHGLGNLLNAEGPFSRRALALADIGFIVYVVDESRRTVTVSTFIWVG